VAEADLELAQAELLNAVATVPQMEAALNFVEAELHRTVIRAPIDGIVIKRDVDSGQTVAASLEAPTLFTIAQDLREMKVHAKIDEADVGRIKVGQRSTFTVDAFPGRTFNGTVTQIRRAPEVIENVVTYTVVIETSNPDLLLLPGMTAIVNIVVRESGDGLTVPNAALGFAPQDRPRQVVNLDLDEPPNRAAGANASVWTLDRTGAPTPVPIHTGMSDGTVTEIVSGDLRAGQKVIVGQASANQDEALFGLRLGF
jgi:HlyD family secretion protein